MRTPLLALLAAPFAAVATPLIDLAPKPPAFFLAGDSTTAINGGWGDGFVALLRNGAVGQNKGHSGATTASFVAGGDWKTVLDLVRGHRARYKCYVTIQFGHNDQKQTSNITLPQFKLNLQRMANDVTSAGGTPLILTPLTRRTFTNGVLDDSLADVSQAAKRAAAAVDVALLDLNAVSRKYVQAIGQADADRYNLAQGDRTHLNEHGTDVFARVVADLIVGWRGALGRFITPDREMSGKIAKGVFV